MYKFIKNNYELLSYSFIALFLELLIIRLVGTEIRIFAYLSNLVLLATFVGMGLGMLTKRFLPLSISGFFIFITSVIVSTNYIVRWPNLEFKLFTGITELLAPLSENYIWLQIDTFSKSGIIVGLFLMVMLFIVLVLIFAPIGQALGKAISRGNKPIVAYSVNIAASLVGLWAFQTFSTVRFTPYFGIIIVLATIACLAKDKTEKLFLIVILVVSIAYLVPKVESKTITYWSPYQKLTLSLAAYPPSELPRPAGRYLEVNNVGYMSLLDLGKIYKTDVEKTLDKLYHDGWPINKEFSDHYSLPYQIKPDAKNVLIIGAGGGNDAAAAVRANIPHVDAVEIDPTIIEIGKKFHPEKPYIEASVSAIVEDGRAYLERTNKKYDLVVMGLADSHTLSSSLTNVRLDHYLYTKESLTKIKEVLTDNGVLSLSFEVARPWIGDRIQRSIEDVFGTKPKVFEVRSDSVYGWGGIVFVVSKNPQVLDNILTANVPLADFMAANARNFSSDINPLTDDWPYLYLDKPRLPIIHILVALILGGGLLLVGRRLVGRGSFNWSMFFWGAAFLLFEFQNVSKSSLLFGTTWQTNLFTVSAILLLLLGANWAVHKKLIKQRIAFILLLITIIFEIVFPLHFLNNFSLWQKIIFGSLVLNLPLFFGGIIFTSLFAKAKNKAGALGANFLGSVFGGFAEMLSFYFGIHFLLIFVLALYLIGYAFAIRSKAKLYP